MKKLRLRASQWVLLVLAALGSLLAAPVIWLLLVLSILYRLIFIR